MLQEELAERNHVGQSPFQGLHAQCAQGSEPSAPAQLSFPQLEATGQQQGQIDWAALSQISELQQLQLNDQLRLLEAQARPH